MCSRKEKDNIQDIIEDPLVRRIEVQSNSSKSSVSNVTVSELRSLKKDDERLESSEDRYI